MACSLFRLRRQLLGEFRELGPCFLQSLWALDFKIVWSSTICQANEILVVVELALSLCGFVNKRKTLIR